MNKKLYIGCSLANAPLEFTKHIEKLKNKLSEKYEILHFLGQAKGSEEDVFKHDVKKVKECDIFLAEVSYPSLGLGFEIAIALNEGKKVIAVAKEGLKISRLIQGIPQENFSFKRYKTINDIMNLL